MKTLKLISPETYLSIINGRWALILLIVGISCFAFGYMVSKDDNKEKKD